jgi:hypothetical protein
MLSKNDFGPGILNFAHFYEEYIFENQYFFLKIGIL